MQGQALHLTPATLRAAATAALTHDAAVAPPPSSSLASPTSASTAAALARSTDAALAPRVVGDTIRLTMLQHRAPGGEGSAPGAGGAAAHVLLVPRGDALGEAVLRSDADRRAETAHLKAVTLQLHAMQQVASDRAATAALRGAWLARPPAGGGGVAQPGRLWDGGLPARSHDEDDDDDDVGDDDEGGGGGGGGGASRRARAPGVGGGAAADDDDDDDDAADYSRTASGGARGRGRGRGQGRGIGRGGTAVGVPRR